MSLYAAEREERRKKKEKKRERGCGLVREKEREKKNRRKKTKKKLCFFTLLFPSNRALFSAFSPPQPLATKAQQG